MTVPIFIKINLKAVKQFTHNHKHRYTYSHRDVSHSGKRLRVNQTGKMFCKNKVHWPDRFLMVRVRLGHELNSLKDNQTPSLSVLCSLLPIILSNKLIKSCTSAPEYSGYTAPSAPLDFQGSGTIQSSNVYLTLILVVSRPRFNRGAESQMT